MKFINIKYIFLWYAITSPDIKSMNAYFSFVSPSKMGWQNGVDSLL